jgi:hypothetical protein
MIEKKCYRCQDTKLLLEFHKHKNEIGGFKNTCKLCCKELRKLHHQKFRESENKRSRAYSKKHAHRLYELHKQYIRDHPEKASQWWSNYRNKHKNNPTWRLNQSMSGSIGRSLRGKKAGRHWENLVGYSLETLITSLESKFKSGMTWDNYGEWHIDHIKPKSRFSFTDISDKLFQECWSLDNLQPLWAADNIRKYNKYNG